MYRPTQSSTNDELPVLDHHSLSEYLANINIVNVLLEDVPEIIQEEGKDLVPKEEEEFHHPVYERLYHHVYEDLHHPLFARQCTPPDYLNYQVSAAVEYNPERHWKGLSMWRGSGEKDHEVEYRMPDSTTTKLREIGQHAFKREPRTLWVMAQTEEQQAPLVFRAFRGADTDAVVIRSMFNINGALCTPRALTPHHLAITRSQQVA